MSIDDPASAAPPPPDRIPVPSQVQLPPPGGHPTHEQYAEPSAPREYAAPSFIQPPPPIDPSPPALKPRRAVGKLIAIILLSVALAGALAVVTMYVITLDDANSRISEQEREIRDQQELIDKKETFGAAMENLLDAAQGFDGVLMGDVVPFSEYKSVARQAWEHRWKGALLDADTETVLTATRALEELRTTADAEAAKNSTGTTYEAVIDQLGSGFVASRIEDADTLCRKDVLGCVVSDDPYVVHFDDASNANPYMNEWLRTGVAYHEFAHVLQFTNPVPTEVAVAAFDGDPETMADCFVLTYLDGWTLDHRVYTGRYQYWDVNIGYGYTCNDSQREVVKDWYEQIGYLTRPITQ